MKKNQKIVNDYTRWVVTGPNNDPGEGPMDWTVWPPIRPVSLVEWMRSFPTWREAWDYAITKATEVRDA